MKDTIEISDEEVLLRICEEPYTCKKKEKKTHKN